MFGLARTGKDSKKDGLETRKTPTLDFHPPQKIACGSAHTLFLKSRTAVCGWGKNRPHNPLGLSKDKFLDTQIKDVLKPDDVVVCLPPAEPGKEGKERVLEEVACGSNHSCVLECEQYEPDGRSLRKSCLWAFGFNHHGQLGFPKIEMDFANDDDQAIDDVHYGPRQVVFPSSFHIGSQLVVQRICCGSDHTLAMVNFVSGTGVRNATGRVFAWGLGNYGALGINSKDDVDTPQEVWFPDDIHDEVGPGTSPRTDRITVIRQVAAGSKHSLALSDQGKVYAWGHGGNGRLGMDRVVIHEKSSYGAEFTPRCIQSFQGVVIKYIGAGEAHSAAVDQLGGLYTWGQGSHGRCGHGVPIDAVTPTKVETLAGIAISLVCLGLMHTVAITVEGQLYSWGKGPATGLDVGTDGIVHTPRQVRLREAVPVDQIAAGPLHTMVLLKNGKIFCFGSGSEGRMPFETKHGGAPQDESFPREVEHLQAASKEGDPGVEEAVNVAPEGAEDIAQICSGGQTSAVLLQGGEGNLWMWGAKELLQPASASGAAEVPDQWLPVPATRGFKCPIKMIAIGLEHCLAITTDSILYSWGKGAKGQLGTGNVSVTYPQMFPYPTNVVYVAAGEEHSACIIHGGEAYSWGNAEGGRLGLGTTLSEGVAFLPRQVAFKNNKCEVSNVPVRSVSCGSHHTGLVTEEGKLVTFGTGWFGRLGYGDTENRYSPDFVPFEHAAKDVYCAMYHTCVVDESKMLWVCGRDNCICFNEHQSRLVPFDPFHEEPRRLVEALAACDEHTLVITSRENDSKSTELWVWGRNNRGQLGIPEAQAPRIEAPWLMRIPEIEARSKSLLKHRFVQVATAPGHSMVLLMKKRKNEEKPEVYSWGCSGSGRLGFGDLDRKNEEVRDLYEKGFVPTVPQGSKHSRVYPPLAVEAKWEALLQQRRGDKEKDVEEGQEADTAEKSVANWAAVQALLTSEAPDQRKTRLKELVEDITVKFYDDFLKHIHSVSSEEASIRQLERMIESEYIRALKALDLAGSTHFPKLEGRVQTDSDVLQRLYLFEELVWIMQQQPLHMANLGTRLLRKSPDAHEVQIFLNVTKRLYADLNKESSRNLNLFKAMLRVMIKDELIRAQTLADVFDPNLSRVPALFTQMCTNPFFIDRVALPILDPGPAPDSTDKSGTETQQDRPASLVSYIINYTLYKNGTEQRIRDERKESKQASSELTGIFAMSQPEYEGYIKINKQKRGEKNDNSDTKYGWGYKSELKDFQNWCRWDKTKDPKAASLEKFIDDFLKRILHPPASPSDKDPYKDVRMLLVFMYHRLDEEQRLTYDHKGDWAVCAPIASVVLGSILGGVLDAIDDGPYSLLRLKIQRQVKKEIEGWNSTKKTVKEDIASFQWRVLQNIKTLGCFLKHVVRKHSGPEEQRLERDMAIIADRLKESTCKTLLACLRSEKPDTGPKLDYKEDITEMQLTADLYTTHFSMSNPVLWLTTADLLELSNLLWDSRFDSEANDRVQQLVREIMPKKYPEKGAKKGADKKGSEKSSSNGSEQAKTRKWLKEGEIWLARDQGESHNFLMRARFLEFARPAGEDEPIFCDVSQAPVPRFLAKKSQQGRPIRPFRESQDEVAEGHHVEAMVELERLLLDLAAEQHPPDKRGKAPVRKFIAGRSFEDLKQGFEERQMKCSQDLEGRGAQETDSVMVHRLEEGKRLIDSLRESIQERDLMNFVLNAVQERAKYNQYLQLIRNDVRKTIQDSQEKYRDKVWAQKLELRSILDKLRICEIPDKIQEAAIFQRTTLAFMRIKGFKQRTEQKNPTPAQKVKKELLALGKTEEEVMEMVGAPARKFKIQQLIAKGVVVRLNENIPRVVRTNMVFIFQFHNEGCNVKIYMKSTLLKDFTITRQDVVHMESAAKTAIWPYADNFIWVNCFRLRSLLAWLTAEGGL